MRVKHLSFRHDQGSPYFFKDLSFFLESGKIHALHGKNGVGKSMLLHLLSNKGKSHGIMTGEIVGGENAILVNQRYDFMIADQFSFQENVMFACMDCRPSMFKRLQEPSISLSFLEQFQIDPFKPVCELSGGQRQILALSMALQKRRSVLLLDEPTAALDEQNAIAVFEFLKNLATKGMTLFIVCHDKELMDHYTCGQRFALEMKENGERGLRV